MSRATELLWLPGLLCDHRLFAPVNQRLMATITPHCALLPALTSVPELAQAILRNAPETFVLGGLSMGGILAFELYRQAPERVQGLILLDTNAADEKKEVTQKRNQLVERAQAGDFHRITPEVLLPVLIHPSKRMHKPLTQLISAMAEQMGLEAFIAHAKALASRPDARPLLATIQVPTLIICGRDDALCPVSNHLLMAEHIPASSLHIIKDCGHLSTLEKPAIIASHINYWLPSVA